MTQTVVFKTLGCRVNQAESEALRFRFEREGWQVVDDPARAQLIVVNSCAVTQAAEAKLRGALTALRRKAPTALLAVVGCAAYQNATLLVERFGVRLVLGNGSKANLPDYLPRLMQTSPIIDLGEAQDSATFLPVDPRVHPERIRVQLKVQDGCDYFCHYCIVPYLRGKPRSRELHAVLAEIQQLVTQGCREVVLTGINLGMYQTEDGDLTLLVRRILEKTSLERLRLSSIEPDLIPTGLIALAAAQPRLCPHWHIPLQHGSDQVLKSMGRRYDTAYYRELVDSIRRHIPEACIGADVMVGYPDETPADFETMLHYLEQLDVNYLHVFRYSPRPGTTSARQKDRVPSAEKRRRSELLLALGRHKRRQFRAQFLHRTLTVLFEKQTGKDEWQGLTGNYLPVRVNARRPLLNQIEPVKITAITGSYLIGELNRG